jgi:transcriptional regulator PpsR
MIGRDSLQNVDPELMVDLVTAACDLALVVSPDMVVQSILVNPQMGFGTKLSVWQGMPLDDILTMESVLKLRERLAGREGDRRRPISVELNHAGELSLQFPIRYSVSRINPDGTLLMVGRDLRPIAELQQQLVAAQLTLERDYEAQRELETRYRVLMELHPSPVLIVSMASGKIVDLNAGAIDLIGATRKELMDAPVAQEFEGRRRGEFLESLVKQSGADPSGNLELTVRRNQRKVLVSATMFRASGGKMLLCRIGLAESGKAQFNDVSEMTTRLFSKGIDAIVFIDGDGVIRAANDSFLNLTDSGSAAMVQGRPFADFLARGEIDLRVLIDNVKRVGHMRHFSTRLNTDFSGEVAVELSATWFQDRANPCIGLVIRDSNISEAVRLPGEAGSNDGLRKVMQLVGYSNLKDIVAETTEIIEKMCIETALELTGNNRVAAAELLSLSRQSLYVKLRKFGILSKENS